MRTRLSLRARIALWCAALVMISGTIVVVLMIVIAGQRLHDNAPQPGPPPAGQPLPGQPGGPPADNPLQRQRDDQRGKIANETLSSVQRIGLILLGAFAVSSIGIGWLVAGRMLQPLRKLTAAASKVSHTRMGERIRLEGPRDELRDLAETFDQMLDRLEGAFAAQRAFVGDASHELRTPLTVMRTEVDVALDDPDATVEDLRHALDGVGEAVQRMQALTDALLALSRAEVRTATVDVDLADIARRATEILGPLGFSDRVLRSQLDTAPVTGDPVLLERLVSNLLENAARHNQPGGEIVITTRRDGTHGVLTVENDGPNVPPAEVDALFDRFLRRTPAGGDGPSGFGLGLAISAAVVRAHDGEIVAVARPQGGLSVTVRLAR